MVRELDCIAISVDYRLGPVNRFPAALEDAEDVINAVLDPSKPGYRELRVAVNQSQEKVQRAALEFDKNRIAFSGFSSGGNIVLNMALSVSTSPGDPSKPWPCVIPQSFPWPIPLLLFYPALDTRQLPHERSRPPGLEAPKGFLQNLKLETELMPTYVTKEQAQHPRASPGLGDMEHGELHKQAKMLLVLPDLDTLTAYSGRWVDKVTAAGRRDDLSIENVKGVLHGWTQFPDAWLNDEQKRLKMQTFDRARDFVREAWTAQNGVASYGAEH